MTSRPTISLVLITRNRSPDMKRLLLSMPRQTVQPREIIVVDASDEADTFQIVSDLSDTPGLPAISHIAVKGDDREKTKQRNIGAHESSGSIIAFLDDDTIPAPDCFQEGLSCFDRHPEAVGVAGYITHGRHPDAKPHDWFHNALTWRTESEAFRPDFREYKHGVWVCRKYERTSLLECLGLVGNMPPGCASPSGFGREIFYIPPDGQDHRVDFCSGAGMNWRRDVFERCDFSPHFTGSGPFEEFDFCFQAHAVGDIILATRARVHHQHSPLQRPTRLSHGYMWSRNAWYTWRRRWGAPRYRDRILWWLTALVLAVCRFGDAIRWRRPLAAATEGIGRIVGLLSLLVIPPRLTVNNSAPSDGMIR